MKKYALCLDYGEGFWEFFLTGGYHLQLVPNEDEKLREIFVNYEPIVPYIEDIDDFYSECGMGEYVHIKYLDINSPIEQVLKDVIDDYYEFNSIDFQFIFMKNEDYDKKKVILTINLTVHQRDIYFVLDLYCGGGGSAMGIHLALRDKRINHKIIGFDNRELASYPFKLIKEDVIENKKFLSLILRLFQIAWASPPCQKYISCNLNRKTSHPDLIGSTRDILNKSKIPYVIENVSKAPIRKDVMLCGEMFGLGVFRHRFFEINGFSSPQPKHLKHKGRCGDGKFFTVVSGGLWRSKELKKRREKEGYFVGTYDNWCKAMGINWIPFKWKDEKYRVSTSHPTLGPVLPSRHPLTEAIPPAYSKYIMKHFLLQHPTLLNWT